MEKFYGYPFVLEDRQISEISFVIGESPHDIKEFINQRIVYLPTYMFNRLLRRLEILNPDDCKYVLTSGCIVADDTYYIEHIRDNSNYEDYEKFRQFFFCWYHNKGEIANVRIAYNSFYNNRNSSRRIKAIHDNIRNYYDELNFLIASIRPGDFPDYNALFKAAKRLKIKLNITKENEIHIQFNNVKVGDEIEGHIVYKKIFLRFNMNFDLLGSRFYFSNWYYDSSWGLEWTLHPHIRGYICYGNRDEDFSMYLTHNKYDFLLDLIRESAGNYCPGTPFASIKAIASRLNTIKRAVEEYQHNSGITDYSQGLLTFANSHTRSCLCGFYTYNGNCTNPVCVHNRNAIIMCSNCGQQTIWNNRLNSLTCPNTDCHRYVPDSPPTPPLTNIQQPLEEARIYIPTGSMATNLDSGITITTTSASVTSMTCRSCGSTNLAVGHTEYEVISSNQSFMRTIQPSGYYCQNGSCSLYTITQYNLDQMPIEIRYPENNSDEPNSDE